MKLIIKEIVLWPRNHDLRPRRIEFVVDKINVITGESETGKSAISSILDYCLGSEKCSIPIGLIREKCEWYGVLMKICGHEMLVARHDPDDQQATGDMFLAEGEEMSIPLTVPGKNINVEVFKDRMDSISGIPKIDLGASNEYANPIYPAFRDMAAFNFQPQHIVANPYTLFFKTDTTQHREKLRAIFPFVLGSVTPAILVQQKELKDLERELKRIESDISARVSATQHWMVEIESYYIQAMRYGLLQSPTENRAGWTAERYVSELQSVKRIMKDKEVPRLVPGASEQYARELQVVKEKEEGLAREVGDLTRQAIKLEGLGSTYLEYEKTRDSNKDRLRSAGWLREKIAGQCKCPLCLAEHDKEHASIARLLEIADCFSQLSQRTFVEPSRFDVELQNVRKTLRAKEEDLQSVRREYMALQDKNRDQAALRQQVKQIYWFAGKLEQALESFSMTGDLAMLRERASEMRTKVDALDKVVNPHILRKRLSAAIESVSRSIAIFAKDLCLEHLSANASLDERELTVKFNSGSGRTDYLWEVGSGQNWVGYHLATLLAMHHHFLRNGTSPVPSFLVLDQPSQVYFPDSSWTSLEGNPKEREGQNLSADINGVKRIFNVLARFLSEHKQEFQIIVTEHAGLVAWEQVKDSVNVVGNWRDRLEDYLIPNSWIETSARAEA